MVDSVLYIAYMLPNFSQIVSLYVTSFSLVGSYQHFKGTCCIHLQGTLEQPGFSEKMARA
jgi:hypothetical protein